MALSQQLFAQTSPPEMGNVQGKKTVFSCICRRTAVAHQSQPRCFYSWAQRWPCHLHLLVCSPASLCLAPCAEAEV